MKKRQRSQVENNEYRREMLIEGTITSLAEKGVAGTTVSSICNAAKISRGLLNHYYPSKEELVAEAFRRLFSSASDQVQKAQARIGNSALDRLRALPKLVLSPPIFTARNRNAWLSFWHEIRFNPVISAVNAEAYFKYTKRIRVLFVDAAKENGIVIDDKTAAIGLVALIDGLWLELSINDKVVSRSKAIHLCSRYIDQQLGLEAQRDPKRGGGPS